MARAPSERSSSAILTVPNVLSFARILLIPVFSGLIVHHGTELAGLLLFGFVASTDWVDGAIARRTGTVTDLGKILDPTADRLVIGAGLVALVIRGAFPLWAALLILVRDALILGAGAVLLLARRGRPEVRSIGKVATFGLMTAVPLVAWGNLGFAFEHAAIAIGWTLYAAAIVEYYVATILYARDLRRLLGGLQADPHVGGARGGTVTTTSRNLHHRGEHMEFPQELRYTKEHEWVRDEGNGRVRVGITDYAQDALGDVVYVDVPEVGTSVSAAQPFSEVESTKSVSDVYSPVTGTVVERNPLLDERPELVNEQPYGDGWLVVLDLSDPSELEGLMDAAAYQAFLREVEGR